MHWPSSYRPAMPRRRPTAFDVILCTVLFTLAMTAWGWVVDASVPSVHAWLVERVGHTGVRILLVATIIAGFYCAYLSGKAGKPNGT